MFTEFSRTVGLIVEYDGTHYYGFQRQNNSPTIQAELESAISRLTLTTAHVRCAGRTDAGVHARGQVISFSTSSTLPCKRLIQGMNHLLPRDIAVREAYDVPVTFDPRRHAKSRVYRYTILNRDRPSPLLERYAYRVSKPLNIPPMKLALRSLEGEHNFASLGVKLDRSKSTLRKVYSTRFWIDGDLVQFEVEANAFLRHQMRRIAGLLVNVGTGKISLDGGWAIMAKNTKHELGARAPTSSPRGLCLIKVNYNEFPPDGYKTNDYV